MKLCNSNDGTFTSTDYVHPTPDWAVMGADEHGFDPCETRWRRKSKKNNTDNTGC